MRPLLRFLLPALLVAGCASTTQVTTRFTAEGSHPPRETLLLVAHTPEGGTRETWELTCKEIFSSSSLTILLSHQELPLWYEGGKNRILDWAQSNDVQRILVVELTHLLIDAAAPPTGGNPTWQVGIGGELAPGSSSRGTASTRCGADQC